MTTTTPSAPDEVVLDEKALEAAHDAVRDALGYRHGNMVNLAGILVDFEVIAAASIRAYLRASPQPAGVTDEQVEAAARVLAKRAVGRVATTVGAERMIDKGWVVYADDARAALEASRLPSPTDTREMSDDEERLVKLMEGTATAWEAATGPMVLQKPSSAARTLRKAIALINRLKTKPTEAPVEDGYHGLDTPAQVFFYEQDFYVLSNFSSFNLKWHGRTFPTSEHAYHWSRFSLGWMLGDADATEAGRIAELVMKAPSAHEAFKIAQEHKDLQHPGWPVEKIGTMRAILRAKAEQHEYVRRKLLATGDRELVENSWRDDFWGWGPNRDGHNTLGKLWMEVRTELRLAASTKEE